MKTTHTIRIVAGAAVILLGAGVLLSNLNLFNFDDVLGTWWPLIIIGIGLYSLLTSLQVSVWPIIAIAVGAALQLRQLGVVEFNIWQLFWPIIIIGIGVSIIRSAYHKTAVAPDSDSSLSAILSGMTAKSESKEYQGGKVTAIMGGVELDLRSAIIKKEATLELFTLMGGVEIRVPTGWTVRSEAMAILGGIENTTKQDNKKDAPVLNIIGTVSLGGVEIRN